MTKPGFWCILGYVKQTLHLGLGMGDRVRSFVKEYRLRQGLTQQELAEAVGVSRQSINAIERGRYIPSLPLALRFACLFHCPTDELFELEEEKGRG